MFLKTKSEVIFALAEGSEVSKYTWMKEIK